MIETDDGMLYTGITTDLTRRFNEHCQQKNKAAKFFYGRKPLGIVYSEHLVNRSLASKREAEIKRMKRAAKVTLIQSSDNQ